MLINGVPMSKPILMAAPAAGAALVVLAAGIDQTINGDLAARALGRESGRSQAMPGEARARLPGSAETFSFLSGQSSKSCGLRPDVLGRYSEAARLQGSCCAPMDFHRSRDQVEGLRAYRSTAVIREDPYDISVRLAKELLGYQQSITLTRYQAKRYEQAVTLSEEGDHAAAPFGAGTSLKGRPSI